MPLLDQIRQANLVALAQKCFDPNLHPAEIKVLGDSASSQDLSPSVQATRLPVRPDFLRWLATDPDAATHIDPKGLRAHGVTVPGKIDLRKCDVKAALDFNSCTFDGDLLLESAETKSISIHWCEVKGGFNGDLMRIDGPLNLYRCSFTQPVSLLGAEIESRFTCDHVKLLFETGDALNLSSAIVKGDVFLNDGFESAGTLQMNGAQIQGDLNCQNAKLLKDDPAKTYPPGRVKQKTALSAERAEVGGGVFLSDGFEAYGSIELLDVRVKGFVSCVRAIIQVAEGDALQLSRANVGGGVYMRQGFQTNGAIRLQLANISGLVDFRNSELASVHCTNLNLTGDMDWMGVRNAANVTLNLVGATLRNLHDDKDSWVNTKKLYLDNFRYDELKLHESLDRKTLDERIDNGVSVAQLELNAKDRIDWLKLQPPDLRSEPQPWMQLRDLFEKKGDRKGAKHVVFELKCVRALEHQQPVRLSKIVFAWLEEAPSRIGLSIAFTMILFTSIFWHAGALGAIAPTEKEAYESFIHGKPMPAAYPRMNPFIYTLENALPLAKLGQDDKWAPDQRYPSQSLFTSYGFLVWTRWILVLWGWFQAGVLGAALVDRFKN